MGFFTKRDKVKRPDPGNNHNHRQQLRPARLLEPPNVFAPSDAIYGQHAPEIPPRPSSNDRHRAPEVPPRPGSNDRHHAPQVPPRPGSNDRHQRPEVPPRPGSNVQHQLVHHRSGYVHPHHANASSPQLARDPRREEALIPHHSHHCGPVVVNQHYYINGQHAQSSTQEGGGGNPYAHNQAKFGGSVANLARGLGAVPSCSDGLSAWYGYSANLVTSTISTCDEIAYRLNNVLTMIDGEHLKGHEMDLFSYRQPVAVAERPRWEEGNPAKKSRGRDRDRDRDTRPEKSPATDVAASVVRGNYFSKVEQYANSKLPRSSLAPFAVYVPTWPLLCLAAQYSLAVYERPAGAERESHVSADWRTGSKAMCIKSVPMDSMHTIVFAIRGTATFMDWAVNLNAAPVAPTGFLDDPGNLCHAGFLSVARRMVRPVASRLRQLLREDPSRSRYSLLITGHSAGGAVASLLYAHMLSGSREAESDLRILTGSFRRVHCVTFGTPPLSLLPITRPDRPELKNSVFLSFVNEGDPVARADKGYVLSLLELLASPVTEPAADPKRRQRRSRSKSRSRQSSSSSKPMWPVPVCTLSNAGRIVVLRSGKDSSGRSKKDNMTVRERLAEGVVANVCSPDQLRGVVWGDPVAHLMKLYAGRIETLAVEAVTVNTR